MKNSIIIKSYQNGLGIYLDPTLSFPKLLDELALKFKESRNFFKDAQTAISFNGRTLTLDEERQLLEVINQYSDLNVLCIVGNKDDTLNQYFNEIACKTDALQNDIGTFYRGTLKDGAVLEMNSSIIILGDVYCGCTVVSNKDIIVLGGLYGEAYAGASGEANHFVVALDMSPTKLKISDSTSTISNKNSIWKIKSKMDPKIAYMRNDHIYIEPLTKELLNEFPF